ncbi:hypothetical protein [Bosea sp. PAMC 26642]|uniref:hypothetical protein n=1 Tax=Bosea sp. (strain PAMC 26642) TaxID=1792307 RepID=UPI00076FED92|nr:hypothetical protein [Bosea sp. PAMC 26642]AMJ60927.1 hypothetical protein AXW83_12050 [Bosea sp. PAMC 26642]
MTDKMTRQERSDLSALIRKRERVLKAAAAERAAAMRAEFEKQCASIYSFDDDEVWKQAMAEVDKVVADAHAIIAARCAELGIPKEFAPGLSVGWYGRGQNAVKSRRAELREVAKSRIEAIQKEAATKIERTSLEAQSEVLVSGLESDAAKLFLSKMTPIDELMPAIGMEEVTLLLSTTGARL